MAHTKPLQVFAYDDLLILYWRRKERITSEIRVFLDSDPLEKPIMGVEFAEGLDCVLVAFAKGIPERRNFAIRIVAAESRVLVEAKCRKAQSFSKKLVGSWSLASRIRLEKALLLQSERVFPQLSPTIRAQIAAALAEPNVTAIKGPDGLLYVRVPWLMSAEPGLLDATFRALPGGQSEDFSESVQALLEDSCLHFFSRRAMAHWTSGQIWILDTGKIRYMPIRIPQPEELASAGTLAEWIDGLAANSGGNPTILRGFAASLLSPLKTRSPVPGMPERLEGEVEGIKSGMVVGWAYDFHEPLEPVSLKVSVDEKEVGEIEAHLPRKDSESRGYGNCGFVWRIDERWMTGERHVIRFRCATTGAEPPGSPLIIGRGEYDCDLELDEEGFLVGWVRERCVSPQPTRISLLIDGEYHTGLPVGPSEAGQTDSSVSDSNGQCGFRKPLPDRVYDTDTHVIEVEAASMDGRRARLHRKLRLKAGYRGHIDLAGPDRVTGWVMNTVAPRRPVLLDLLVNGTPVVRARADLAKLDSASDQPIGGCGFDFPVPLQDWKCGSLRIDLCLAGTELRILGPGILHTPYDIALRCLTTLAETLNDHDRWNRLAGGLQFNEDVTSWVRTQIIAKSLAELRRAKRIPSQLTLSLSPQVTLPHREQRESTIDVIVPVYLGRDAVRHCLASVLQARCERSMELIVIDDASPDPELHAELRRIASIHRFTLLENKSNLGFVGTVNCGMRLHPNRDVILLNSDTVVADGWLDRLHGAAYRASNIGTVTPFSNNATICSFPHFCLQNQMPEGVSVQRLDALFASANDGQTVDLPTAVGFCMFIRRDVLEEVGYFDEGQWGKGYGEENDFCLRASILGWRHVAACDVFVEHEGGVSFAGLKHQQIKGNLEKLNALYPDYAATIQRFVAQDPLAGPRNRVSKVLLKEYSSQYILFIMHGLGGGAKVAADDLATRLAHEGVPTLELMSVTTGQWRLACQGLPYAIHYRPEDFDKVVEDLRELGVWHIHYHQTMHFPRRIWELAGLLGVAYDFTVHDYLPICPRITMIDESGYYCGDSQYSAETCTRCVRINGLDDGLSGKYQEFGHDVAQWRKIYGELLKGARRVYAPSNDVAQRFRRHFRLANLKVEPHPRREIHIPKRSGNDYVVAVLGAIGTHKGYDTLLHCVRNAAKEGLPLKFAIIGFTCDDEALRKHGNATITGRYRPEELPCLIEDSGARAALFLSRCPETYCYTLTEAWESGLYPIALDVGAIAERIRDTKHGRLVPMTSDAKHINRVLMEVLREENQEPVSFVIGKTMTSVLRNYYGLSQPNFAAQPENDRLHRPLKIG